MNIKHPKCRIFEKSALLNAAGYIDRIFQNFSHAAFAEKACLLSLKPIPQLEAFE